MTNLRTVTPWSFVLRHSSFLPPWSFVLRHSSFLPPWSFVLRHSSFLPPWSFVLRHSSFRAAVTPLHQTQTAWPYYSSTAAAFSSAPATAPRHHSPPAPAARAAWPSPTGKQCTARRKSSPHTRRSDADSSPH